MAIVNFEGIELYLDTRTATQWATVTKTIPQGFPCVELGDGYAKLKVGDGANTYADLPYVGGDIEMDDITGAINAALASYYTMEQVDDEIADAISGLGTVFTYKGKVDTVDKLPADTNTVGDVWIVGAENVTECQEYYWNGTAWDYMGLTTEVDLSNYYTKGEVDTKLDGKVDKVDGMGLSSNDFTTAEKNKLAGLTNYDDSDVQDRLSTVEDNYVSSSDTLTIRCSLA